MPRTWTDDHGRPGLRRKFDVYRSSTAYDVGDNPSFSAFVKAWRLGADGEFVFVLRPETDKAAYHALREYACKVNCRDPQLAREIRAQLDRIRDANA